MSQEDIKDKENGTIEGQTTEPSKKKKFFALFGSTGNEFLKMKLNFADLFKRFKNVTQPVSSLKKRTFIKTDKQIFTIIGIAFAISVVILVCYWFLRERPYYDKLIAEKDELIKTLKFMYEKQKKIYENAVSSYEEKLKNEYIPKSLYDDKINDYEKKLNNYVSKDDHEKQMQELEQKLKEEYVSKENLSKAEFEQKITSVEQKLSVLEDKNIDLKETLDESMEFVKEEKENLEGMLSLERKKALIPSLVLPETKNNTLTTDTLQKLVAIKDKLAKIEEMNIALKPDTYFEMGLISYYNKQYEEAIERWENAVSLNKNNTKAYICLGIVYKEEDMTDNAIKVLKRGIEINPKYSTLHLVLASMYEQKGALDDAIYEYSKALEINPETIDIHNILGTLYEKKGLKEEAKKSFAQYEKLKASKNK